MRFTISRDKLQDGLTAVGPSVPSKTTLPVLANLLLETTERGIRLCSIEVVARREVNADATSRLREA